MRRHLIGIIALSLLFGAAVFWIWPPSGAAGRQFEAACWRAGALAAVLWLTFDDIQRLPTWLWTTVLGLIIVVALRPKLLLVAVPVILALAFLRPRLKAGRRK